MGAQRSASPHYNYHLMQLIPNNLMKLGASLCNVPQKLKETCYKISTYFGLLVREYNLYFSPPLLPLSPNPHPPPRRLTRILLKKNNWL
jgi:hypothetical protein